MAKSPAAARIGILDYPHAQQAAVHGLVDLFETAARLDVEQGAARRRIEVERLARRDCGKPPLAPLRALILPPCLVGTPTAAQAAPFLPWLMQRHAGGTWLCSVCAGAFLLAETGLLDGRPATTHWALADAFAQRFPRVRLDAAKLLIDAGDVLTAGGVMAWTDLGLHLIERLLGPAVMLATARMFLIDPAGREQRNYASPTPRLDHGDSVILELQRWLQSSHGSRLSITAMAERSGLGQRTFLRRFQAATGQNPVNYLQQLRVNAARQLLELTARPVDQIAWQVGYEDSSAFHKVFRRVVGLTPGAYRLRFAAGVIGREP